MRKIIGILRPFDLKQKFYVYEDGNKTDSLECTIEEIPSEIIKLAYSNNITRVDLTGPKQYIRGISQKIQNFELTNYSKNSIEFNLI